MKGIVSVQAAKKLSEIKSFIEQNGFEIAKANARNLTKYTVRLFVIRLT